MKKYQLYYSNYCYFCQKVLMFLSGHQHLIELNSTSDREHHTALMQGGGKGQVPCLRIESEPGQVQWLYESDDILAYIKKHGLISAEPAI